MEEQQTTSSSTAASGWLRSMLGSTREFAILFVDDKGTITAWLGASELLFGYSEGDAVGMPFCKLFTHEDVALGLDKQERDLAASGGRSEDDRWHVRKDGSRFWGSGVMEAVRDDSGEVIALVKTVRDRTDIRVQIETLNNRLAASERLHVERNQFLTSMAHELRNQLNPVASFAALMTRLPDQVPTAKMVATMRDKVQVISRLPTDLSEGPVGPTTGPGVTFEPLEVQSAVNRAVDAMTPEADSRRQVLRVTLPEAPIQLDADSSRLDQMLVNLLSNALKFSPQGAEVQVSATVEANMIAIRVEDNGMGIDAEVLPKIFELFTRESHAEGPDGLGVGLAVVKQLATLHSGFIEGRSPGRGKGSIFTLRLPLKREEATPATPSQGRPAD